MADFIYNHVINGSLPAPRGNPPELRDNGSLDVTTTPLYVGQNWISPNGEQLAIIQNVLNTHFVVFNTLSGSSIGYVNLLPNVLTPLGNTLYGTQLDGRFISSITHQLGDNNHQEIILTESNTRLTVLARRLNDRCWHAAIIKLTYLHNPKAWDVSKYYVLYTPKYIQVTATLSPVAEQAWLQAYGHSPDWTTTNQYLDLPGLLTSYQGNVTQLGFDIHRDLNLPQPLLIKLLRPTYTEDDVQGWWLNDRCYLLQAGVPIPYTYENKHYRRCRAIQFARWEPYSGRWRSSSTAPKPYYEDLEGALFPDALHHYVKLEGWYLPPTPQELSALVERYRLYKQLTQEV